MNYVQLFQFKWIGPLTICFLLPFSFASAQSCGDIISINPYSGDTERVAIEDCNDPFQPNQGVPNNLDLRIDGVAVAAGANEVEIPEEFLAMIYYSRSYQSYRLQVYEKGADDFTQIDLRPPEFEDLSQAEGLAIIEAHFAGDPDIEAYRQVFITGDMSNLTVDQQIAYSEFQFSGIQPALAELYSPQLPTGSYWLVFTEEVFCLSQAPTKSSWLAGLRDQLIPTAHAQFGGPCSPGYVPKRFVVELNVTQAPEESTEEPTGASSVLFLPGIQASRLYAGEDIVLPGLVNNIEKGNKLWEQTNDKRIAALAMDETGQSVHDIYTEDVLDEITGRFFGANIYKGFLSLLEDLKTNIVADTGTTTINDYLPFAYDWRYSVFDVATQPVQYESETKLLKDEVISLAEDSHTGKVTIVGHSNGGLVAKALLHEYGDNELAGKVDKLVMIGTPQLGTPKGVSALLHGQVMEGFGDFLTSDALLRETILNMPGTYTLLPSVRYLEEVADEPLVRVTEGFDLSVYDGVSTRSEFTALLLDSQNAIAADPSIHEPVQLNDTLLANALAEQAILDAWQPPTGVEVYEVAGTGIPTPAALHYEVYGVEECDTVGVNTTVSACVTVPRLKPVLKLTNQGDKTVVLGSAQGQVGDKVKAVVNLKQADDLILGKRQHADLTEVPVVQAFVDSVIRYPYVGEGIQVPAFTEVTTRHTIHAGHSPVTLRITTPGGLVTGIVDGVIRQDIAGTQFITLGGSSYVIVPDDISDYTLEVIGIGNGVYTLETSELSPEDVQSVVAQFVASTTDTMVATMDVSDGVMGDLQTDFDGDGVIDEVRTAEGELVVETQVVDDVSATSVPSQSSATRVGGRTPTPSVLGISTFKAGFTVEQYELLEQAISDIQSIVQQPELTQQQLDKVSQILRELLLITNTEESLVEV